MNFNTYIRNPFTVEALLITEENLEEVAELIGEIRKKGEERYISVNRRLVPHVTRAYVGWWVTKVDNNLRCYSPKAFVEQFTKADPTVEELINIRNHEHSTFLQWEEKNFPNPDVTF